MTLMNKETIKVTLLDEKAKAPTRQSKGAAGYDIYTLEGGKIRSKETTKIRTGISLDIPSDSIGVVFGRSGLAVKHWLGIIDTKVFPNSHEELILTMINNSDHDFDYTPGFRIAQIVFIETIGLNAEVVKCLDDSERGASGFGSTGLL